MKSLLLIPLMLGLGAAPTFAQNVKMGPFTLPPDETARIEFEAEINNPVPSNVSSVSNQGTVTFDTGGSVLTDDPVVPGDNNPTVTPLTLDADVSITKVGPTQAVIGTDITYMVMVTNGGPDNAPNVVVTDTLPAGVTFKSAKFNSTDCSESSGTVTCNLGGMAANDQVDITIVVTAPGATGTLTNQASLTTDAVDANTANNSASFDTTLVELQADLNVAKSDSPDPVVAGQQIVYTVTVNNGGPDAAENVVATDTLPTDVSFVSTSGCDNDPIGVPDCNLGTIASGGAKQYTLTVTVNSSTPDKTITNAVSVSSDTADPDSANNSTTADTHVQADSDGDGIPDAKDQCKNSNLSDTVVIDGCDSGVKNTLLTRPNGCTINDEIQQIIDAGSKNHGQFVRKVGKLLTRLQRTGVIKPNVKHAIIQCAAQSNIP